MIQPGNYVRDLLKRAPGDSVTAQGWVKTRRDGKNVHFIQLNDGSSPTDLQVVLDAGVVDHATVQRITTGACISAEGELVASMGKGQAVELKARSLTIHGAADPKSIRSRRRSTISKPSARSAICAPGRTPSAPSFVSATCSARPSTSSFRIAAFSICTLP